MAWSRRDRGGRVPEHRGLGDLEDEVGRVERGLGQDRLDLVHDVGSLELERETLTLRTDGAPARPAARRATTARQASARTQRPRARIDPFSSATADELVRQTEPASRVTPADERLDASRLASVEGDDRLVVDDELLPAPTPRASSADSSWRATIDACIVGLEDREAALAGALAVYIATSAWRSRSSAPSTCPATVARGPSRCRCWRPRRSRRPAIGNGTPSASIRRRATASRDAGRAGRRAGRRTRRRRAGRPGRSLADARPDPLADGHQQLVAGGVTERVVDDLEVVEVEEQDDRHPVRLSLAERGFPTCSMNRARLGRSVSGSW